MNSLKMTSLKTKWLTLTLCTLLVGGSLLSGCGSKESASSTEEGGKKTAANLFYGLRNVPANEIYQVLPQGKGKRMLVDFKSQYCLDCKKIEPVLEEVRGQYPDIEFLTFDIMKDKAKNEALFKTFRPTTVPVLIFIDTTGKIINVMYNYHSREELVGALDTLSKA